MAQVPELAYQFRQLTDTASPTIEHVLIQQSAAVASAAHAVTLYTVPAGRILVLNAATLRCEAGAAQTVLQGQIRVSRGGQNFNIFAKSYEFAAAAYLAQSWPCSVWLHPGWVIDARGEFSAGAAANNVIGTLIGQLIPRGNVS